MRFVPHSDSGPPASEGRFNAGPFTGTPADREQALVEELRLVALILREQGRVASAASVADAANFIESRPDTSADRECRCYDEPTLAPTDTPRVVECEACKADGTPADRGDGNTPRAGHAFASEDDLYTSADREQALRDWQRVREWLAEPAPVGKEMARIRAFIESRPDTETARGEQDERQLSAGT